MQLAASLPAGWLSDHTGARAAVLRGAAAIGLAAGAAMAYALLATPALWHVVAAMAALGTYRGFNNPPMEALFADSVRAGSSSLYTYKYAITVVASGVGPALSVAMFHALGNTWTLADCRAVLLAGLALMAAPLLLMCFFDDRRALGHASEALGGCAGDAALKPGRAEAPPQPLKIYISRACLQAGVARQ